ncbi:MAG: MBL fold metallo-hydrolase [Candidatus Krumholzibacteriia bacterium]
MPRRPILVDLDQPLTGQRCFISAWLVPAPGADGGTGWLLVDPGPPSTADVLLRALQARGVERLELVLLTHVHLDHAGATSAVLQRYPEARVAVHERGREHLLDPERLWHGSLRVLGPVAEVYGRPRPVPAAALATGDELAACGVRTVPTPGHAAHHQSFVHGDTLYVGEAAGTYLDEEAEGFAAALPEAVRGAGTGTEPGAGFYLRPATPPRFFPGAALGSLERLIGLDPAPRHVAFAHHGLHTGDTRALLAAARDQLLAWLETAREEARDHLARIAAAGTDAAPAPLSPQDLAAFAERTAARLRSVDPHFRRIDRLPPDIREREEQFTLQTLLGILDHLERTAAAA